MTIKVGILGAGFIAGVHVRSLRSIKGVEIAAICDSAEEKASRLAESVDPGPPVFTEFARMLESVEIDALYICLPPFAHAGEVEAAAARGIHLFLEKPLGLDTRRARSMVRAIESAGVKSQVGFQMRFQQGVKALKKAVDAGEAGKPVLFTGRYWTRMDGPPWWRDRSRSGGQILEQVIHIYDMACHFMGEAMPEKSEGHLANVIHQASADYTIEDLSVGLVRHPGGAASVITGCNAVLEGNYIADFRIVYENAVLDYRCTGKHWEIPDHSTLHIGGRMVLDVDETEDPYRKESEDFLRAIAEDTETCATARCGLTAMELVESVINAAGKSI